MLIEQKGIVVVLALFVSMLSVVEAKEHIQHRVKRGGYGVYHPTTHYRPHYHKPHHRPHYGHRHHYHSRYGGYWKWFFSSAIVVGAIVSTIPNECRDVVIRGVLYKECQGVLFEPVYGRYQSGYQVIRIRR